MEEEFSIGIYSFPGNSYDDLHQPILWKGSFQLWSTSFLQIPMTICIFLLFGRGVFNWDLLLSYKFLWRSASAYSSEEEFLIQICSFPTNSYDDLHLPTLRKTSFQLGSTPFLQIPMTICICLLFGRGVCNWDLLLSYKFLWRSARAYCVEDLSTGIYSFPINSYDELYLLSL